MNQFKIIGYGVVGQNMHKIFTEASIHDPIKNYIDKSPALIAFVCVPTDMLPDGSADTSTVVRVVIEDPSDIFVIKSTVPPGTCEKLAKVTGKRIVFSPEYFGKTKHANYHKYDFSILGGDKKDCSAVADAYKTVLHPEHKFHFTDHKTAEYVKYKENSWLATKVTFCNEWYRIAQALGVDYNEARELWLADPRINRSHTDVYRDQAYYDSHCLNKDVPAIVARCKELGYTPKLMERVISLNEEFKNGV